MPELHQQFHHSFHVRIDVDHCAAMKLVLPARKEIIQDEFLDRLRMRIRQLYFELLADEMAHSLSYKDFELAQSLGIELPEAAKMLRPFVPDVAESDRRACVASKAIPECTLLYAETEGAVEEQNVSRAISRSSDGLSLFDPQHAFEGYSWYDALACITLKGYRARLGETVQEISSDGRFSFTVRPDRLDVLLEQRAGEICTNLCFDTDVLIVSEEYGALDEADVFVKTSSLMTPSELVGHLEAALFSPSDDAEAGSYDQQREWFSDEAEDMAITLLDSVNAADLNLIKPVLRRELTWRLPKGTDVTIRITGRDISVSGLADDVDHALGG